MSYLDVYFYAYIKFKKVLAIIFSDIISACFPFYSSFILSLFIFLYSQWCPLRFRLCSFLIFYFSLFSDWIISLDLSSCSLILLPVQVWLNPSSGCFILFIALLAPIFWFYSFLCFYVFISISICLFIHTLSIWFSLVLCLWFSWTLSIFKTVYLKSLSNN